MKKKCRIKPPSNRYKNGSVLRGIGAGAYGLAEGILDTATFGLTDELTDKGFEGLQNLAGTPEEELKAQEGIRGITNTAGAAGAAIGASVLAPQLAPKMFKSAISEGVEGAAGALGATNNEALGMAGQGLTTASNIAMPFINFRYGGENPKTKKEPSEVFQSVQRSAPINPNWQNEYYHFDKDNARVWKTVKDRFNTFKQDVFPNKYSNVPEFRKITTTFKNGGVTPPHTNMYPNGGSGLTGYLGYSTRYPDSPLGGVSYGKQFKANEGYHIPSLEVYGSKYGPGIKGQYTYINPSRTGITSPTANVQLGYDPKRRGYVEAGGGVDLNILNDRYNKLYIRPQGNIGINAPSKAVLKTPRMFLDEYINFNYGVGAGYEKTFDNKSKLGVNLRLLMDPVSGKRKESRQDLSLEEAEQIALMDPSIDHENIYKSTSESLKFAPQFEAAVTYTPGLKSKREKNIEKLIAKQNAQKTLDAQSKPQIENYTFMRDDYKYGANMYANGGYGNNNMNQIPVTQFGNGGSHEENPLGGIPQGMGANGKMNLVEEGELKIPDPRPQSEGGFFIVSADPSMKITKGIAEDYNLPKKLVGKSVLKAAESILRKGTGREGDSIEENSINIDLSNFLDAHEELTAMAEAKEEGKFMEELAKLEEKYPEYMQALMGAPKPPMEEMPMDPSMQGQQGPSPEEQAMMEQEMMAQQQGGMPQGMPPGAMPMGVPGMDPAMMGGMPPEAMGMAYGGKMFRYGGNIYENGGIGDPPPKSYKQPVVSDNTRVVTSAPYYQSQQELQSAIKNKKEFDALKKKIMDDPDGHIAMPGYDLPLSTDSIRMYHAQPGRGYTVDYFNSPTVYGTMNSGNYPSIDESVEAIQKGKATYNPGKYYDADSSYYNIVTKEKMLKNRGYEYGGNMYGPGGNMIKRADGSYSQRGLWDNIRANKGSGKAPTKEMLKQEKKIKGNSKMYGSKMYENGGSFNNPGFKALPENVQNKIKGNSMGYGGDMYEYGSTMGNMYGMGTNMYLLGDTMTVDNLDLNSQTSLLGGVGNDIIGLSEGEKKFDPANQFSYQKSLGTAALQGLPVAANLAMGLFAPPKDYSGIMGRLDPVELERQQLGQRGVQIDQSFAQAQNAMEAAGGPGYMSNIGRLQQNRDQTTQQALTDIENKNTEIQALEEKLNLEVQKGNLTAAQAELQLNEAAEAAKAAMLGKGLEQLGDIGTAGEQNKLAMMYNKMYAPNYQFEYQGNPFAGMFNKDQEG